MRHRVEGRKLKRTASHRAALLRALATQLFRHKRIRTTEAKAKEARRFAEAIISRAKRAHLAEQGGAVADIHARRVVARDIKDAAVVRELFSEIAPKVAGRNGGYTRVVKLGSRLGDGARMAILELVDYNMERDDNAARLRTKRTISRAERVARSRARQAAREVTEAPAVDVVDQSTDAVEEKIDDVTARSSDGTVSGEMPATDTAEAPEAPTSDAPSDETTADDVDKPREPEG